MNKKGTQQAMALMGVALLWVVADYLTKQWALVRLAYEKIVVNDFMNFYLTFNPGAAFGILARYGGIQRWFFMGFALAVTLFLLYRAYCFALERWEFLAYAFIVGGALGNALDRSGLLDESALGAMIGHVDNPSPAYVIDFIQWHYQDWYWPVFNVADVAITLGVGCLFVHLFLQDKKQAEAQGE